MKKHGIWLAAAVLGIVNAVVLYVFEFIGIEGTAWLWNDVFQTDMYRWRLLPVALVLGLVFTALVLVLRKERVGPLEHDLVAEIKAAGPVKLALVGVPLAIGAASLLAGASLGPEAPLMAFSAMIAAWVAYRLKFAAGQMLVLASVGALLVAFLGSLVILLVPLLLLWKEKQFKWQPISMVLLAGLVAFATIELIDHKDPGYGSLPSLPSLAGHDYVVALIVGFFAAALAVAMNWLTDRSWRFAKWLDGRTVWYEAAAVFSLVLGAIYLLGGETIQFSGSIGSKLLAADAADYGIRALLGLIVFKMLATAWSKGTGFHGGMVFPSIYIGFALGLLVNHLLGDWSGAGAIIGGIAGMLCANLPSPVMAGIFLLAVIPLQAVPIALCAIVGTMLFKLVANRLKRLVVQ